MKKLLILLVGLLLLSFGNAFAFPLYQGSNSQPGTWFEDENLDYFVDSNGDGLIGVGDVLVSAIEFPFVNDLLGGTPTYSTNTDLDELVALAVIELIGTTTNTAGEEVWLFGEHDDGDATTDDAMVKFYSGSSGIGSVNFDSAPAANPTKDQAIDSITDGNFLWSFSIRDDEDAYWIFDPSNPAANSPSTVGGMPQSVLIGSLTYALEFIDGDDIFADIALGPLGMYANTYDGTIGDGFIDLTGTGIIYGGGSYSNAFAVSDIDVYINPIPEPATLTLFGFGLLGLAAACRRRK